MNNWLDVMFDGPTWTRSWNKRLRNVTTVRCYGVSTNSGMDYWNDFLTLIYTVFLLAMLYNSYFVELCYRDELLKMWAHNKLAMCLNSTGFLNTLVIL